MSRSRLNNIIAWLILLIIPVLFLTAWARAEEGLHLPLSALSSDGSLILGWGEEFLHPALLPSEYKTSSFESDLITLVNQERIRRGIPPLATNAALTSAARGHSQDMASNDFFSHIGSDGSTFVQRLARAGYTNLCAGGENIAAGYSSPQAVFDAWMSSAGHRDNILNPSFRDIGVGYVYEADDRYPNGWGYKHYWTQDFGAQDCWGPTPTLPSTATPTPTLTRTATRTNTPTGTATKVPFTPTPTYTMTLPPTTTPTKTQTPTYVVTATPTPTSQALETATVIGLVTLEGRPQKPNDCWRVSVEITLLRGDNLACQPIALLTDPYGSFLLTQVTPGLYDVRIKNPHTLANRKQTVEIVPGLNYVDLGVLLEGDASNDNIIDVLDFSLLRASFGNRGGQADFNHDGVVDVLDFSLLRAHFGLSGDILIP